MSKSDNKRAIKAQRAKRTRAKLHGTADKPRLSVFISNLHVSAQAIDDDASATLASASTIGKTKIPANLTERATLIGTEVAEACKKKKITRVVLDRGNKKYHGRVKALADAAKEKGLEI